jgi:hypothetical protein
LHYQIFKIEIYIYNNFHQSDDTIKKSLMVWTCDTNGNRRGAYRVLVWRPERRKHLEDFGVDRRIVLKQIFKKWDGEP